MGKFGLVDAICQSNLSGYGAFKSKETRLCEKNGNTFTLSSYYIYPCSCFHFTVNEISRNKTENCLIRLTAVDGTSLVSRSSSPHVRPVFLMSVSRSHGARYFLAGVYCFPPELYLLMKDTPRWTIYFMAVKMITINVLK